MIEDNAQAIDARGDDFQIGELSDAVSTSFIIQKNLGTFGDGGAVYTEQRRHRRPGPQAAQPRLRRSATTTASASTAAWTTSTPAS